MNNAQRPRRIILVFNFLLVLAAAGCFSYTALRQEYTVIPACSMADEDVPVLKNTDPDIEEDEYLSVPGPSGSGKSALMNIIGGPDAATGSDYMLPGRVISVSRAGADGLYTVHIAPDTPPGYIGMTAEVRIGG